jgi:uncharacterized protein with HEPN domain
MRDSIARIREYTSAGGTAFFSSTMVRDAVIRNLEVIGEAAKGLADALKQDLEARARA